MFYDPARFPFLAPIAAHWHTIRDEYASAMPAMHRWFEEWNHNGLWKTVVLFHNNFGTGALPVFEGASVTRKLCAAVPGLRTVAFSLLQPGAEIFPHVDNLPGTLRAHLALYTNADCALTCGGETRTWQDGQWLVFDENVLHSASNKGSSDRVVLLIDFDRTT